MLDKINDVFISEWMLEYGIEDSTLERDRRVMEFFAGIERDDAGFYFMDNAEEGLEKIINYYNELKLQH